VIWVIAGTRDGREIAASLADRFPDQVFVTVVTSYGKELSAHEGLEIRVGRFTEEDMVRCIGEKKIGLMIDASHPYAAVVSRTARSACRRAGISYLRYERPEIALPPYEKLYHTSCEEEAARRAGQCGKRILLTTGSKTLPVFVKAAELQGKEIWARVLPLSSVIKECEELGMQARYIIAMQGPFSYAVNRAMIHDLRADTVIMKNSGLIGGSDTKFQAAADEGCHIIVIDRPPAESGFPSASSEEEVLKYTEDYYGIH
jgi:precorrin-6A/cobalt-precorrin-6A reductase